jgi:hypothetical protein
MPEYVRVRWIGLKPVRESSIAAHRVDPDRHEVVDKPAVDLGGTPIPAKYQITVDDAAAARPRKRRTKRSAPKDAPAPAEDEAENGHQATDNEEMN